MKRKLALVGFLALAVTLLFYGFSLADICPVGSPGCVTMKDLGNYTVSAKKIKKNSVHGGKIQDGSIDTQDLANGAVTAAKVANNSLTSSDIKNEAGADFADGDQSLDLTSNAATARFVTITAPAPGVVIVNASGYFYFNNTAGAGRCSITTASTVDFDHLFIGVGDSSTPFDPFGATRGFTVGSGSNTFNLVCEETNGDVTIVDSSITAIYVPTQY